MKIQVAAKKPGNVSTDILVLGLIGRGAGSAGWGALRDLLGTSPAPLLSLQGWKGKAGDFATIPAPKGTRARLIVVATLAERGNPDRGAVRDVALRVGALARKTGLSRVAFFLDHALAGVERVEAWSYQEIGEGLGYGGYVFDNHLETKAEHGPADSVYAYFGGRSARDGMEGAISFGLSVADAQNRARTLVNEPANVLNPESYVQMARDLATEMDLDITVLSQADCEARGMGAFLAVGQGGGYESQVVHLIHRPKKGKARARVALVGKAVTFDSGGLCLKPASGQATMKMDMGGSAAVFGAIAAAAAVDLQVEVHAIFAACENMTGSKAFHTGDVITASNGKTIEVLNTDAEGRLTLADALPYAGEQKPDYIIDLATLTGACMVALGPSIAGLMGRNRSLNRALLQASDRAGEPFWELPLHDEYKEMLQSKVADIKNLGARWGGALTAGLFLEEFVPKGIPWAHIDIAGPAYVESPKPTRPFGGTGFPVRALIEWMRSL
ncbi:MAG: leucyl aminopeptidase [Deltaproteobacteria bacterium]|nr:leucyl aminopeptidase [Deltaproteobacteria bacterium]